MSEKSHAVAKRQARSRRSHAKARTNAVGKPRLIIFRSNRAIYGQVFDDATGKAVAGASSLKSAKSGVEAAAEVGKTLAEKASKAKVKEVVFDRNSYKYHGQVKALADAAREGGLQF